MRTILEMGIAFVIQVCVLCEIWWACFGVIMPKPLLAVLAVSAWSLWIIPYANAYWRNIAHKLSGKILWYFCYDIMVFGLMLAYNWD